MEKLAFVVLGLAAGLICGVVLGMSMQQPAPASPEITGTQAADSRANEPVPESAATQQSATQTEVEAVRAVAGFEVESVSAELKATSRENEQLRAQVEMLETELAQFRATEAARAPSFAFGRYGEISGVRNSDWSELSAANDNIIAAIREIRAAQRKGERPARETSVRLQRFTEVVRKYEYETIGVIGTWARHNGELTHPLTTANFFAASLRDAGMPLSAAQKARIEQLGLQFESEWDAAQQLYGNNTPRCEKLLDEYLLKGKFVDALYDLLTPEQRAHLIDPETHRRAFCDVFCPTMMLIHTSVFLSGKDGTELKYHLSETLDQRYRIGESQQAALQLLIDSWLADVTSILTPVSQAEMRFYTYEEGAAALRATVKLVHGLRDTIVLDEAARAALLNAYDVFVPRIVQ
jgi:hypothetical protein